MIDLEPEEMNPNNNPLEILGQNPLEIPEILYHVLEYIKSTETLLNCRLVAHSWNQIAVELLNNKGCTIGLDSNNIHQYVDLLKSNINSTLSHLNSNLRINFPQHFSSAGSEYEREVEGFTRLVQLRLTSRIQVIGLTLTTNIRPLTLIRPIIACTPVTRDDELQQLLEHVAPTLRYLKIIGPMNTDINFGPPTFPNLTSIHCFGSISKSLCEYLTKCIVNSSKLKLKNLKLTTNYSIEVNPIFDRCTSVEDLNLEKLDLSIDHVDTYNQLCALKSCRLKTLVVQFHTSVTIQPSVVNLFGKFILNNFPNLTTLELPPTKGDILMYHFLAQVESQPLEQIKTFGFYLRIFINSTLYQEVGLVMEKYVRFLTKFPDLTKIKLDLEVLIFLAKYFTNSLEARKFAEANFRRSVQPLVTTMVVFLNLCCYGQDDDENDNSSYIPGIHLDQPSTCETINYLLPLLWPNVTNLTLKQKLSSNSTDHPNYHICMNHDVYPHVPCQLLNAIITPWDNSLRRLRIKNYVEDWLNSIIAMEQGKEEEEGNIIRTLSNLELLSILGGGRRNSNSDVGNILQNLRFVDDKKGKFDLLYFLERIQSVEKIELDEALLQSGPPPGSSSLIMEQVTARNLSTNTCIQLI